jgi:ABC-2 type transport system ATP-binding protein/lipopolysaccharide transport system ATP-binding protein
MTSLPFIHLDHVSIEYPIYSSHGRSLKRLMVHASTGGRLGMGDRDRVVVKALSDITLRFEHGERVGLVGPNGAGKTTLLRALTGVYEPVAGSIEINGRVTSLFDLSLGIDPDATGYENIQLRGLIIGLSPAEIEARRQAIADFTELGEFLDMPVRTYSAGMGLRLAFAVSTSLHPEILLMDEWLAVGDAMFLKKAEERTRAFIGEVGVMVTASHSTALLRSICNRVIWLDQGRVVRDGPPGDVIDAYLAASGAEPV